jgi:hypothetical protein
MGFSRVCAVKDSRCGAVAGETLDSKAKQDSAASLHGTPSPRLPFFFPLIAHSSLLSPPLSAVAGPVFSWLALCPTCCSTAPRCSSRCGTASAPGIRRPVWPSRSSSALTSTRSRLCCWRVTSPVWSTMAKSPTSPEFLLLNPLVPIVYFVVAHQLRRRVGPGLRVNSMRNVLNLLGFALLASFVTAFTCVAILVWPARSRVTTT